MKRKARTMLLLAALAGGGQSPAWAGNFMSSTRAAPAQGASTGAYFRPEADRFVGPYGQPVQVRAPAEVSEPTGADYARAMLAKSYPGEVVQQAFGPASAGSGLMLTSGLNQGPTVPGPVPPYGPANPPGAVAAIGALGPKPGPAYGIYRSEVRFVGPAGMKISWYAPTPGGKAGFTAQYLEAPARYNFVQASIYRLKLSDIPNRPGVELYPTLEVVPANARTATFLAHAAVPINFTEEDFEQVAAGNFIVKVIYLPDPQFQDLAATGPDEVVSSRLEPGVDPLVEAKRRGSILAVVRLGNIDLEAPNTPAMDAPPPGHQAPPVPARAAAAPNNQMQMPGAMGMRPGMPPMPGMPPYMAGMPGMQMPGMPTMPGMPMPGMQMPGMPMPGMGMPPGMIPGAPTMPATGAPSAPTVPTPLMPTTPPAPATPLGKLPTSSTVQPVSATTTSSYSPRSSLMDLLGRPTTQR